MRSMPLMLVFFLAACGQDGSDNAPKERALKKAGFYSEIISRSSQSSFEGIGHFRHCFLGERDLGQCDSLSVSPSGHWAVWVGDSGRLQLSSDMWANPSWLTDTFNGLVSEVRWDEQHRKVVVIFDGGNTGGIPYELPSN